MGVGKEISKLLYLKKSCSDFETLLHALRDRGRCLVIHEQGIYQPTQIIQPCAMAALLKRNWDGKNKGKGVPIRSYINSLYHERHYCHHTSFVYDWIVKQLEK